MQRGRSARFLQLTAFVILLCCDRAPGASSQARTRADVLAEAHLPEAAPLPMPTDVVSVPDEWDRSAPISVRFSSAPPGTLSARRVSHDDGRLYLEVFATQGALTGTAEIAQGEHTLRPEEVKHSLWLSLAPRIGRLTLDLSAPGMKTPELMSVPTTLVEVRGRRIFLNGEPFLMKGATARGLNEQDANYIHSLGLNTLRGLGALSDCERHGFMNIASLNFGDNASTAMIAGPDTEFEHGLGKCLDWLKEHSADPIASPNTLILQLGNERTGSGNDLPGAKPLTAARRHVGELLVAARNLVKPLAPMLPVGYANQDLGFIAPDCMDVYMHNSYLEKDRYGYPWQDFMRWQGCLPPEGSNGAGRPFVNSEFGANRYLCQSYLEGPNNPFLEKIHAWNFPQRWAEFMENGTAGGAIYCLYDLDAPRDQGCSRFGIMTYDRKPKLACWEVGHMWRDFDVDVAEQGMVVSFKRDYRASGCQLSMTPEDGPEVKVPLDDFPSSSKRNVAWNSVGLKDAPKRFRWRVDFMTHAGLINQAAGLWPTEAEEQDFLDRLKTRDTYPFLSELFDAEVLTAQGKPAPRTLAEMAGQDGIIPVALRKRNSVTYLLLISREDPSKEGALRDGVTIDVAFAGKVSKVNDMTGESLPDSVDAVPISGGLRLRNVQAARIPGAIGKRSKTPFMLPIYRITR